MIQQKSIEKIGMTVQDIADSMTKVATNIALLGVEGDADAQMKIITDENNKVLDYIRELYHIPPLESQQAIVDPTPADQEIKPAESNPTSNSRNVAGNSLRADS